MSQPNGIAFSPDGKHLYVDDSRQPNIRVFDFLPNGNPSNGNLFVVGSRGIWVWDRQGNHLGTIITPEQPANLAWGDEDYGTLYITAAISVYRTRTKVQGFVP